MNTQRQPITEKVARSRAENLCARSEHCVSEIRAKLTAWQLPRDAADRIVSRLVSEGYIDENRYARAFVRSKFRFNQWGRDKILHALKAKGISDPDIADGLSEIAAEESDELLTTLLARKARSVKYNSLYERDMKLLRFALSRGFSLSDARKCISQLSEDA